MVPWTSSSLHSTSQTASRSVQPFLHSSTVCPTHRPGARPGYYVWGGGLSPGNSKHGSASLYRGEAESSVAFEAPAEEPNLTLVTDSFLQFISWKFDGGKSLVFGEGGANFAAWEA